MTRSHDVLHTRLRRFASWSWRHGQCSWYHMCDLDNLDYKDGGDAHVTIAVNTSQTKVQPFSDKGEPILRGREVSPVLHWPRKPDPSSQLAMTKELLFNLELSIVHSHNLTVSVRLCKALQYRVFCVTKQLYRIGRHLSILHSHT